MFTTGRLITIVTGILISTTLLAQQHLSVYMAQFGNCSLAPAMTASDVHVTVGPPVGGVVQGRSTAWGYCMWLKVCLHPPDRSKLFMTVINTTPNGDPEDVLGYLLDPSFCAGSSCPMFFPGPPPAEAIAIDGQSFVVEPGEYYVYIQYDVGVTAFEVHSSNYLVDCDPQPLDCPDCLSSFSPMPGEHYRISAWVSREDLDVSDGAIFMNGSPFVEVECPPGTNLVEGLVAVGPIIDGWQLIEGSFTMPPLVLGGDPLELFVNLGATTGVSYFDDIRIFPNDASMKSYVYDPKNMRFVAELDERHFTTFYEYDPEGRLVRVKKETERGIMTIKESRQNTAKETAP